MENTKHKCINCGNVFTEYEEEIDCMNCEDGDEEVEAEFGEGS